MTILVLNSNYISLHHLKLCSPSYYQLAILIDFNMLIDLLM